jgi:hypothetical protein
MMQLLEKVAQKWFTLFTNINSVQRWLQITSLRKSSTG